MHYHAALDNRCYVYLREHWSIVPRRTITLQITDFQSAWLDAIADIRKTTRSAVVREAIGWLAARESARVARTRHYALIGLIAEQEAWNPVDDYLRSAAEIAGDRPLQLSAGLQVPPSGENSGVGGGR